MHSGVLGMTKEQFGQWAVGNKLMYGKNDGTMLDPQGNTTRSEAAAIIQRYMN